MNELPTPATSPKDHADEQVDVLLGAIYNLTYDQAKTRIELRDALGKRSEHELQQAEIIKVLEQDVADLRALEKDLRGQLTSAELCARRREEAINRQGGTIDDLRAAISSLNADIDDLKDRLKKSAKGKRHGKN